MENKITGRELKNEYQRKWRAAHPKQAADQQMRYWERKADKINKARAEELSES